MSAGAIFALAYGVPALVAWRVAYRTLYDASWDWLALGFASACIALFWPLPALLGSWQGWKLR